MIRVVLPVQLRQLAQTPTEVHLDLVGPVTTRTLLDALEACYPSLNGTLRDPTTHVRRPKVRFFACGVDCSHDAADLPLPEAVASGREPFVIVAAISGG
jgi:sulfur-carrier protein